MQALPLSYYAREGRYELPPVVDELAKLPDFGLELAYPISYGGMYEYPYREIWPLIEQQIVQLVAQDLAPSAVPVAGTASAPGR